jgi:aryl-alcohol dehydrogenase-like predicted oxidoreductase
MQYVQYGRTGALVSRVGFGAMRLPLRKPGDYAGVDFEKTTRVLRAAFRAGINLVDSTHFYHGVVLQKPA